LVSGFHSCLIGEFPDGKDRKNGGNVSEMGSREV
jgi:hypothetical protein